MKHPPKKLSEAIHLALHDLELVEFDPNYLVDMGNWHRRSLDGTKCIVCFAGSIMAKSLEADPKKDIWFDSFGSKRWERVFLALDKVRTGRIQMALMEFHGDFSERFDPFFFSEKNFDLNNLNYGQDRKAFKEAMFDVATMLEVNGL